MNGECRFGFGEMDILNSIDPSLVRDNRSAFEQAKLIILDGNPSLETINEVIDIAVNCLVPGKVNRFNLLHDLKNNTLIYSHCIYIYFKNMQ